MAKKEVCGISGVLGELISEESSSEGSASKKQPPALPKKQASASPGKTAPAATPEMPSPPDSCRARLGRPPGNAGQRAEPKEKVTLRIPSDLIAEYRDWSWEARCQLSELVEKALVSYRKAHRHL